eukprot:3497966-Prymnesium_polylepis.1
MHEKPQCSRNSTTCAGHTGHGPRTSSRGLFMRSSSPRMCALFFMIAASSEKLPRHRRVQRGPRARKLCLPTAT